MVGITLLYAVLLVAAGALIFGHLVLRVVSWIIEPSATPIGGIGAG